MKESPTFSLQKKGFFSLHFLKGFFLHQAAQLSILLSIIFVVYFDTISTIVKGWFTLELSHGVLVLAISGYLIWKKRNILTRLPVQPDIAKGLPITILGCLIFISGKFSSVLLLQEVSLIVTMIGLVWLILGSSHVRILLLPISYLILMFPIFDEILGNLSVYFQVIGAFIAANLLKLAGMPVFRHGQFIEMPHITLEVSKLCNGITHITALVSLAIPIAYVILTAKRSKGIFILLAFLLGILANGLRVALIGVWTLYFKGSSIHGPFSTLYSSTVFLVEASALILIAIIIGKRNVRKRSVQDTSKKINGIALTPSRLHSKGIIIGMIIFLVMGSYLYFYAPAPVLLKKDLKEIPLVLGNWRGKDVEKLGEDFERVSPDSELKRIYYDGVGNTIDLYVGYFASQRQNQEVVNYLYDWLHNNSQVIRVSLNPHGDLEIKKTRYYRDKKMRFAYFWYNVDGKIMTDRYKAKLISMTNAFAKRRTNAAIIVVSFENTDTRKLNDFKDVEIEFLQQIFPSLNTLLSK